jgi:hypothetical protein
MSLWGGHNCGLAKGESLLLQGKLEQALVEVSKERNPVAGLAGMAIAMRALKRKRESDD